jgi:tripartite-type tricarboxylate transporter receptor subunit TctC
MTGRDKPRHAARRFLAAATLIPCCFALWPASAQAPYPSQAIRFVVPYAAGGVPDTVARFVGLRLQDRVGQTVVVENRPGGNGSVAAVAITAAPADGYTLLVTDSSMLSHPLFFKQIAYSPEKDFVPVALLARAPLFLAIHSDLPITTLQEFIEYVKARPGQINYGSSGIGSSHHLTMEAVKAALHLDMTHVPYRGTGQSVPALLGGHVQALFSAYPSLKGAVESNRVRLIANNGAQRSPLATRCAGPGGVHSRLRPNHIDRCLCSHWNGACDHPKDRSRGDHDRQTAGCGSAVRSTWHRTRR